MNPVARPALVTLVLCSLLAGCVAFTKAIHFPDRRPADRDTQTIADRLTAAAEAAPVTVTVWGDMDDPLPILSPIAVIGGCDEIFVHVTIVAFLKDRKDALAVLFGHELGHRLAGYASDLDGEARADAFGVILAGKAGFDPWEGARWECGMFKANDRKENRDGIHPPPALRCLVLFTAARVVSGGYAP